MSESKRNSAHLAGVSNGWEAIPSRYSELARVLHIDSADPGALFRTSCCRDNRLAVSRKAIQNLKVLLSLSGEPGELIGGRRRGADLQSFT
jgi:hypothetical protein